MPLPSCTFSFPKLLKFNTHIRFFCQIFVILFIVLNGGDSHAYIQKICTRRKWIDVETPKNARQNFYRAMGTHITEMKRVRKELTKMGKYIMDKHKDEVRPGALLAEAMRMERKRRESREAKRGGRAGRRLQPESFESMAKLNGAIGDFLYQNDILLDLQSVEQMWDDLRSEHEPTANDTNNNTSEPPNVQSKEIPSLVLEFKVISKTEEKQNKAGSGENSETFVLIDEENDEDEKKFDEEEKKFDQEIEIGIKSDDADGDWLWRQKRQAQTGQNFPRNQWNPAVPIPYYIDPSLNADAKKVIRAAIRFWTENTCLSFAENGPGFPRVKFFPGGGCYSQVGRAFSATEQLISIGRGCEQFGIAAHEIGHTLGFFHGQARSDRDGYINVVYSNLTPRMAGQFAKQSPQNNNNFGIKYDYGSVMHYADTDSSTNKITMIAKERMYQHTMGNNVGPSFLDVLEMNTYYKCRENCRYTSLQCKNHGYPHPRDCRRFAVLFQEDKIATQQGDKITKRENVGFKNVEFVARNQKSIENLRKKLMKPIFKDL